MKFFKILGKRKLKLNKIISNRKLNIKNKLINSIQQRLLSMKNKLIEQQKKKSKPG